MVLVRVSWLPVGMAGGALPLVRAVAAESGTGRWGGGEPVSFYRVGARGVADSCCGEV